MYRQRSASLDYTGGNDIYFLEKHANNMTILENRFKSYHCREYATKMVKVEHILTPIF